MKRVAILTPACDVKRSIKGLAIQPNGCYIDATFGRGGHSKELLKLLNQEGHLIVVDKDAEAVEVAQALAKKDSRVLVRKGSFTLLQQWINELSLIGKVNGILLDLGVSSPQLDDAKRGFSFLRSGPLDMRMDSSQKLTAEFWINRAREEDLTKIFREYGEEKFSKRIAAAIVRERVRSQ